MGVRKDQKRNTANKILSSARTLFSAYGYDGTGIRDIATMAGMSTGAVFASFKDKRGLWLAAMGRNDAVELALWGLAGRGQ